MKVGLAAVIVLTTASLAFASPQFAATFHLTYLSRTPGAPSGQVPLMTWTDPGAPAEVPKTIKRIELTFHPGTRFDTSALPRCHASDDQVKSKGASACPKASRLGTGHTTASSAPAPSSSPMWSCSTRAVRSSSLVTLNGTPVTEFRDRVKGRKIAIEPVLPTGVSLKRLKLRIGRHSKDLHDEPTRPARANRKWITTASFTYLDGSAQTLRSSSPCTRS